MRFQKLLLLFGSLVLLSLYQLNAWAVSAPTVIVCQGWEVDTARVSWRDDQEDVTEWRVQRSTDGGSWTQITMVAKGDDKRYNDTGIDTAKSHRYRVQAFFDSDESTALSSICNNRRIYETDSFRIFYGLRGTSDDCPQIDSKDVCLANVNDGSVNRYVKLAGEALEGSADAFDRVGFAAGKGTTAPGSLDKIPINVVWCDGGGCAGGGGLGLSPELLETAFDTSTRAGDPVAYIVALHEAFHFLQGAHPGLSDPGWRWVFEGQARSIQDKLCIGDDRSTCEQFDDIDTGFAGYVPQIGAYMDRTDTSINQSSYNAVLFWTYITEKFGTTPADDLVEGGMNLMVKFWESIEANPDSDGITGVNLALDELGYSERFVDVWKNFSVASYAKNLTGTVPDVYKYSDMSEPGGSYSGVSFELDEAITSTDQLVATGQFLPAWGAHYYRIQPDSTVSNLDIKFTQDSTSTMYYTILGVKDDDVDFEENVQGRDLEYLLPNDSYDEVVVVVATLGGLANYRYSINGVDPTLNIIRPTTGNEALVGDPSAPEKLLVAVELIDGDGKPLNNVDLNGFTFTVGTEVVPPENVINSAKIQGQHWFTLRAPSQTSDGLYGLDVAYSTSLSAAETNAVRYAPRDDIDSMITVDRSGSMGDFNKLQSATDAAKLFIDSWRSGDQIGLVTFNGSVSLDQSLTPWTDTPTGGSRQAIFDLLDGLIAGGGTALGDATQASWDELSDNGDTDHNWGIVLLSDGLQTSGDETLDGVSQAIKDASGDKPAIHAIAIGPDADQQAMQLAASRTNGTYQYVSEPIGLDSRVATSASLTTDSLQLQLDRRYRLITSKIDRTQQVFSLHGPQDDGQPYYEEVTIPIESNAAELVLTLSFEGSKPTSDIYLYDANDDLVPLFQSTSRHLVWRVPSPVGGNWRLVMEPFIIGQFWLEQWFQAIRSLLIPQAFAQVPDFFPPYLVHVTLASEVTMETMLPVAPEDRISGQAMPILVSLTDTAPITGAAVNATVANPFGNLTALALWDDGAHEDGAANDGIYGNTYTATQPEGSYVVNVNASGVSPLNGSFQREDSLAFFIFGGGDTDGDGIPNAWETAKGTDPDRDDSGEDPDSDGKTNREEWEDGTDPFDPDTDNGGEADGTDDNPLDPGDDQIESTWVVAYPDNEEIHAFYVLRPNYARVDILRSSNPAGPFSVVASLFPGDGLFDDETVLNDTEYCYVAIAYDVVNRQSAPINPSCATPKVDAFAPHGTVDINDGQPVTVQPEVVLTLWASDVVDPESVFPHDERSLPEPAPNSGVAEMMISNLPAFDGASWEPYQTSKPWTLTPSGDMATVYVKYRDTYLNESEVAQDSIAIASLNPSDCSADPLGAASDFSYFVLGDAQQKASTIEGRVAIGANAEIKGVHMGTALNNTEFDASVIVGSDVTFERGKLFYGDLIYGGMADINGKIPNGSSLMGYPINFGIEGVNLANRSLIWSNLAPNGSASIVMYRNGASTSVELRLEGNEPLLNVFEVTSDQLSMARRISIYAPEFSSVLINVSGEEVLMEDVLGLTFNGIAQENIIYNFHEAETASITNAQIRGSLLMPKAALEFEHGILRGGLIAQTLVGFKNNVKTPSYQGCLPLPIFP